MNETIQCLYCKGRIYIEEQGARETHEEYCFEYNDFLDLVFMQR